MTHSSRPKALWHTSVPTPLGLMHLWGHDQGLWSMGWHADEQSQGEAPAGHPLHGWARTVHEVMAGHQPWAALFALPRLPRGTAFQQSVWAALQALPEGTTRTYQQLAQQLGRPNAARAIAQACAQNPWAVAVPCHRIVGQRSMNGYHWGVERKAWLLDEERHRAQQGEDDGSHRHGVRSTHPTRSTALNSAPPSSL